MAIVQYAQASKSKSKDLKHALRGILEGEYTKLYFPSNVAECGERGINESVLHPYYRYKYHSSSMFGLLFAYKEEDNS